MLLCGDVRIVILVVKMEIKGLIREPFYNKKKKSNTWNLESDQAWQTSEKQNKRTTAFIVCEVTQVTQ